MPDPIPNFSIELRDRLILAIFAAGRRDLHREHVIGRESRWDTLDPHKAADKQAGADEQH
jgi:hypothetical protein